MFHPLKPNGISHTWHRIRLKMGLEHDKEFVLHAFRHTYGSTLANTGIDSFRIQKVMGRKSIQTTEKYVQVADSALEALLRLSRSVTNSVIRGGLKRVWNQAVTRLLIRRSQVRALVGSQYAYGFPRFQALASKCVFAERSAKICKICRSVGGMICPGRT